MSNAASASRPLPCAQPLELRERARALGVEALRDDELLRLVAGPRSPPPREIEEGGGLVGLATRGVGGLIAELGLGLGAAARVAAALELGVRLASAPRGACTSSAADVDRWARPRLTTLAHEELWALLLDGQNVLRGERLVARGGVHALSVTAADVLRPAVREAASGFVLVHNHPSGDPCPSPDDVRFTQRVGAAAHHLGVSLVDHVVVGRHGYVSMLESGLIEPP